MHLLRHSSESDLDVTDRNIERIIRPNVRVWLREAIRCVHVMLSIVPLSFLLCFSWTQQPPHFDRQKLGHTIC